MFGGPGLRQADFESIQSVALLLGQETHSQTFENPYSKKQFSLQSTVMGPKKDTFAKQIYRMKFVNQVPENAVGPTPGESRTSLGRGLRSDKSYPQLRITTAPPSLRLTPAD